MRYEGSEGNKSIGFVGQEMCLYEFRKIIYNSNEVFKVIVSEVFEGF